MHDYSRDRPSYGFPSSSKILRDEAILSEEISKNIKRDIDPCDLNLQLRLLGMSLNNRWRIFGNIKREQSKNARLRFDVADLPSYFTDSGRERIRVKLPFVKEGWLTDAHVSPLDTGIVVVVIDGKSYNYRKFLNPDVEVYEYYEEING
jgi:hypothetical protein